MRITKFGHACVRIQAVGGGGGGVVVIDPGSFTEAEALDGADAVLITHEHADHVHPDHLRGSDAPIWTIAAVERMLRDQAPDVAERVSVVRPGDRFDVAGTSVEVVGEKHAVIHPVEPGHEPLQPGIDHAHAPAHEGIGYLLVSPVPPARHRRLRSHG